MGKPTQRPETEPGTTAVSLLRRAAAPALTGHLTATTCSVGHLFSAYRLSILSRYNRLVETFKPMICSDQMTETLFRRAGPLTGLLLLLAVTASEAERVVTDNLVSPARAQVADTEDNPARAFESPVIPMPETVEPPTALSNPSLSPMSEVGLKALLEVQGYVNLRNLSLQDDEKKVYEAEAEQYGETIALRIDAVSGEVLEPRELTETQIRNKLEGEGYDTVDDISRDGETYLATGRRAGQDIPLKIDPQTGDVFPEQGE